MNGRHLIDPAHRPGATALLAAALVVGGASSAFAQLDPLLFLKRVPPNVVVVVDTSFRMLDDGTDTYYDPHEYTAVANDLLAGHYGIPAGSRYRRRYVSLQFDSGVVGPGRYSADDIVASPSTSAGYAGFYRSTRFDIARRGVLQAVVENSNLDAAGRPLADASGQVARWGLVKLPQSSAAWATQCDQPVSVPGGSPLSLLNDNGLCPGSGQGLFGIFAPSWNSVAPLYDTTKANYTVTTSTPLVNPSTTANPGGVVFDYMAAPLESAGALKPAGADTDDYEDRPLTLALRVAYNMISGLANEPTCRNNVVVLVTGGENDGPSTYVNAFPVGAEASRFLNVGGKRVPIYVVAIKPDDDDEDELRRIADNSGGSYFEVRTASEVTRAINLAVQAGYSNASDFNQGLPSEFLPVSPIVGTVRLEGAKDATGASLPDTEIFTSAGVPVAQRSNMTITSGFAIGGPHSDSTWGPGFDGRIRAFRTFRPEPDVTKALGWKFVKDGTRLWPDVDGRPETAGMARVPANPADRNIYTYVPGSGLVAFSLGNAELLRPYLGGADPNVLIAFVRNLPLGAVIGSTPALMDPPSLDPPPDDQYGRPDADSTYAGRHKDRRAIVWFGANNGMVHGVDARTGFEVWAFVPFNLLPKLKTLYDGQPVHQFEYFVDSSPKIAEVKLNGEWKSLLIIGQGAGGTFYQAFDVSEAGMGGPTPDSDDHGGVIQSFADPDRVKFLWAFPDYSHFNASADPTTAACVSSLMSVHADGTRTLPCVFTVSDATPGRKIRMYGDLKSSAPAVAKTVGFTWSDPAVGPLDAGRTINVAIVGSGHFPDIETQLKGRNSDSPVIMAGRAFYLIDLETGRILGNATSCNGTGCKDVGGDPNPPWKNALQADPTAAGDPGNHVVKKAYMGDLDGKYWRFTFGSDGVIASTAMTDTKQPIYGSSALLMIGTTEQYVFFSTGSDLLPPLASAGGVGPFFLYSVRDFAGFPRVELQQLEWPGVAGKGKNESLTTFMERPSSAPSVAGDIVFFTTTLEDTAAANVCSNAAVQGRLYAFTYTGGPAYDTNNSGSLTSADSTAIRTVSGRATAPFIVDQHLYFATSGPGGANLEAFGNPEDFNNGVGQVGVRILSWRELR